MILSTIKDKAIGVLAVLGLSAVMAAVGYQWGMRAAETAFQASQTATATAANTSLQVSAADGNQAASLSITDRQQLEKKYDQLKDEFARYRKRAPLVVRAPAPPTDPHAADGQAQRCVQPDAVAPAAADPELSLGAVRLWNSALAANDLGTGACGANDASGDSEAACAQGAGLTVGDAWDNHLANAKSCAIDRARYQRLIDLLKKRESQQ